MELLKKSHIYFKERFPIKVYFIFILCIYYSSYLFGRRLNDDPPLSTINANSFLGFIVVFLIFMQLRVFDDYKDYENDKAKYPMRKLSKGDITLIDLKNISWIIILLQFITNAYMGVMSTILWLVILFWSICMLKEFFMPRFLNNHPSIYIASHQLIVPLICIYSINIGTSILDIDKIQLLHLVIFIISITTLTIIFHLIKKLKFHLNFHQCNEKKLKTSLNIILLDLLTLISFISNFIIYKYFNCQYVFFFIHTVLYLIFNVFALVYIIKLQEATLKLLKLSCFVYILGVLINSTLSLYPI